MAPLKRRHDEIESSDSEEPSYGKQILPVADLPDDFDGEPLDGMQYLFTVRRDAKALPQFTRTTNPYEALLVSLPASQTRQGPHPALPSSEWRTLSESRWRNFRKNFNQPTIGTSLPVSQRKLIPDKGERDLWWEFLSGQPDSIWRHARLSKRGGKTKQQQQHNAFTQGRMRAWADDEPDNEDEQGSSQIRERVAADYLLTPGEQESSNVAMDEGEVENALKIEPQGSLPTPTGTPAPFDGIEPPIAGGPSSFVAQKHAGGNSLALIAREPTPQLLKLIDEPMALCLLTYFTFWIHQHLREPETSTYRLSDVHARWIYCLLLRIDDYISADDMNFLRNLARACLALAKAEILERNKGMTSNTHGSTERARSARNMGVKACWIIISGIVGIWGQRDLWTDAEDALASML